MFAKIFLALVLCESHVAGDAPERHLQADETIAPRAPPE
jgi:hypothetical protein